MVSTSTYKVSSLKFDPSVVRDVRLSIQQFTAAGMSDQSLVGVDLKQVKAEPLQTNSAKRKFFTVYSNVVVVIGFTNFARVTQEPAQFYRELYHHCRRVGTRRRAVSFSSWKPETGGHSVHSIISFRQPTAQVNKTNKANNFAPFSVSHQHQKLYGNSRRGRSSLAQRLALQTRDPAVAGSIPNHDGSYSCLEKAIYPHFPQCSPYTRAKAVL
ncbi:hypothetical protein ElyMa_006399200 [Elysia marginata]|uniref:Uncharacterized protein n=1 Tax=Elysia marginata TaxID=1093978 RepID=A0AAV4HSM8_9GAST|nr:hypothetical protein ElyMa_006399200 [Elysia marginata]